MDTYMDMAVVHVNVVVVGYYCATPSHQQPNKHHPVRSTQFPHYVGTAVESRPFVSAV